MNLVYVSHALGNPNAGGIATYVANVSQEMTRRGHRVYIVSPELTPDRKHLVEAGVVHVEVKPRPADSQDFYYMPRQEYSDRVYQALLELSQQVQLDIIEFPEFAAEGFATIRAKRLLNQFANTRLVVKLHGSTSMIADFHQPKITDRDAQILIFMEEYCVKYADLVTAPSRYIARYTETRLGIAAISSPNPLNLKTEAATPNFEQPRLRRVIFVGTVHVIKGLDYFIEAALKVLARQPDFRFEIYGKDTPSAPFNRSYTDYLKERIPPEFEQQILFKGRVPYERVREVMRKSGWCVLPSRSDVGPYTCLEAMAEGCVVIGSFNSAMPEMVRDGLSGFIVDPAQPSAIAEIILAHYQNQAYMEQLSRQAYLDAQKWVEPERVYQTIEQGYQQAITQGVKTWRTDATPLVSVILSLPNGSQGLSQALASIKASTYPNYQIVVVNNGSAETDQGLETLEPGIIKINLVEAGLGQALNAGIAASQGEIIVTLNARDRMHPQFLEKAVLALVNNPVLAGVTTNIQYLGEAKATHNYVGLVPSLALVENTGGGSLLAVRREALLAVGGFDEERSSVETWDLQLRLYDADYLCDVLPGYFHLQLPPTERPKPSETDRPQARFILQNLLARYPKLLEKVQLPLTQTLTDLWQETEQKRAGQAEWIQIQADAISYYRGVEKDQQERIEELKAGKETIPALTEEAKKARYLHNVKLEKELARLQAETAQKRQTLHDYQNGRVMRLLERLKKV